MDDGLWIMELWDTLSVVRPQLSSIVYSNVPY